MMFSGMAACSRSRVTGLLQRAELPRVSRRVSRVIVRAASAQAQERKAGVSTIQESKGQIDKNPPRGTRDFPPEEMRARNWLFGEWEKVSRVFGFEEYDVPVLETEELFTRKAGEEIVGQLYNFEDKGGRRVALRPEITPSLVRLVLQKGKSLPLPAKWFAIAQCWRYERTTRGRRREHYQWNMDIVGVPGVEAEAEILAAITTFFQRVGLSSKDIKIKVSNRKVLSAVLQQYGVTEKMFGPVCVIVDKMDKLPREKVEEELSEIGVDATAVEGILSALQIRAIGELGNLVGEDSSAVLELQRLFQLADGYGFADWLEFDASVVRGLAYYTGTVFEAFDRQGTFRAICGGGRYDRLVSTLGGAETPMVGFGFGDAVIMELLRDRKLMPDLPQQVDDVVMPLDEEARPFANSVAARLRAAGRTVDVVLESKKMKWAFKHAERISAERLMVLGSSEVENRSVRVKYLQSREEEDVPLDELCSKQQP